MTAPWTATDQFAWSLHRKNGMRISHDFFRRREEFLYEQRCSIARRCAALLRQGYWAVAPDVVDHVAEEMDAMSDAAIAVKRFMIAICIGYGIGNYGIGNAFRANSAAILRAMVATDLEIYSGAVKPRPKRGRPPRHLEGRK